MGKLQKTYTDESRTRLRIVILGSTGSIGTQTLEIVRLFPERLSVVGLTAGSNTALLHKQAAEFDPECVVVGSDELVRSEVDGFTCPVFSGEAGLIRAAEWEDVDIVVTALVGAVGLRPTVAAIKKGCKIALANKETMVVAGDLIRALAQEHHAEIIPVDSEHSAIYQCLVGEPAESIDRLILTASGGPFLNRDASTFDSITLAEALAHPNWSMGPKITVDSATMMNKGLEVIEARWLFDIPEDRIDVVVHPQSIIHSMVQFVDGSSKAQLGPPDMKVPIQYALSAPQRWDAPHPVMNWQDVGELTFSEPDYSRFPSLALAYRALRMGGAASAVLNAANEVAVECFLREEIGFMRIADLVESVMLKCNPGDALDIEARLEADREARAVAVELSGTTSH